MDRQQARFILQSCRPDGRDADDPRFAEAWQAAESDRALASQLAGERAFDLALGARLKQAAVPDGFRERLLADAAVHAAAQRRRRITLLALAASIVLLLSLAGAWLVRERTAVSFASYRQEMLGRLEDRVQLSFTSENVADLQQWLAEKRGVSGAVIPAGLQSLPAIGCRTWMWNGQPAGLICFRVNGEAVHLLVISRNAVPRAPQSSSPEFAQTGEWTSATWAHGDNVYLLAGKRDRASLEKLL